MDLPAEVYDGLLAGAFSSGRGYTVFNLDDPERYYYRRVYLGCLRANDFLVSHPKWDGKNLIVTGGSQGGALTIVTAGLDPRVTALAPYYPALSDMVGYLKGRAGAGRTSSRRRRTATGRRPRSAPRRTTTSSTSPGA